MDGRSMVSDDEDGNEDIEHIFKVAFSGKPDILVEHRNIESSGDLSRRASLVVEVINKINLSLLLIKMYMHIIAMYMQIITMKGGGILWISCDYATAFHRPFNPRKGQRYTLLLDGGIGLKGQLAPHCVP